MCVCVCVCLPRTQAIGGVASCVCLLQYRVTRDVEFVEITVILCTRLFCDYYYCAHLELDYFACSSVCRGGVGGGDGCMHACILYKGEVIKT